VEDLPGLLVAPVVDPRPLVAREELERFAGRPRADRQELVRCQEGITPEDRDVPGDARREDVPFVGPHVQGPEVAEAPVQQLVEELVVRDELRAAPFPLLV